MYDWIFDLFPEGELLRKRMFGGIACYFRGKMVLVVMPSESEPWNGLLFPTSREFHSEILADFPDLQSHKVLGKWLYLSFNSENFEGLVEDIVRQIVHERPVWGIWPQRKKATTSTKPLIRKKASGSAKKKAAMKKPRKVKKTTKVVRPPKRGKSKRAKK